MQSRLSPIIFIVSVMFRTACQFRIAPWGMLCLILRLTSAVQAESLVRVGPGPSDGASGAVIVENAPLVFGTQLLPLKPDGNLPGGTAAEQAEYLLATVEGALGEGAAERLVKLNFSTASDAAAAEVRGVLSKRYSGPAKPAVSFVSGRLPREGILATVDVVAVDSPAIASRSGEWRLSRRESAALAALMVNPGEPAFSRATPGSFVFVSGQAEKGASIAEATQNTLRSLGATLEHLGLSFQDVVSVRSFLAPMSETPAALGEIRKVYLGPQSFIEWNAPGTIEIELVAVSASPAIEPRDLVEYLTPPGMQPSPVFSRLARTHGKSLIFVSGLYGQSRRAGAEETAELFGQLERTLRQAGSNLRHLAKATYFVSTDDASMKLNELRPRYYDPQRPPAASKAAVLGTGDPDKTLTLDMIAVPAPRD